MAFTEENEKRGILVEIVENILELSEGIWMVFFMAKYGNCKG